MEKYYLVTVLRDFDAPHRKRSAWLLCFSPQDQRLALLEGPSPHDHGSVMEMGSWITHQPVKPWTYGDAPGIQLEPPGWFERILGASGGDWFFPIAKRIAAAEKVPLEEITAAYAAHNGGHQMPQGTIRELFDRVTGQS
jgi:hypothetical protein